MMMWKMSKMVGVMLTVWPTSCTMVFMRGLRLVFPEVEIASGNFIREFTDIVEHAGAFLVKKVWYPNGLILI